jgi:hypothetical protein
MEVLAPVDQPLPGVEPDIGNLIAAHLPQFVVLKKLLKHLPRRDREGSAAAVDEEQRALPGQERRLQRLRLVSPEQLGHIFRRAVVHAPEEFPHLGRFSVSFTEPVRHERLRGQVAHRCGQLSVAWGEFSPRYEPAQNAVIRGLRWISAIVARLISSGVSP